MSAIHCCWSTSHSHREAGGAMLSASAYWQPDATSSWCSPRFPVFLAKAQLFTTQRSRDDTVYADGGLVISANARLDNRDALGQALSLDVADLPDSQLILKAYALWGADCVAHLKGDFVFIIWDEQRKKIFCARDHFGVKTIFYDRNAQGIMITNEHRAFFDSAWEDAHCVDDSWLARAAWGVVQQQFDSPHPNVHVLPPAHVLEFDGSEVSVRCYWQLAPKPDWRGYTDDQWIDEFRRRFERAVGARLDCDYPIGAELSEGLDSNGVVGMAAKLRPSQTISTFSYDCIAENKDNTVIWAGTYRDIHEMLARYSNLEPVWQEDTVGNIFLYRHRSKSNFYDLFGGVVPLYGKDFLRSQLAQARGVRVMLSGWGGDHCVTSYGDHYADELLDQGKLLHLYYFLAAKFRRGRGASPLKALFVMLGQRLSPRVCDVLRRSRRGPRGVTIWRDKHHFLSKAWRQKIGAEGILRRKLRCMVCRSVQEKERSELFYQGLTKYMTECELSGRVARLEYRFPMLDIDLVEFAHSMPGHLKIHQGIERYAFRRVLDDLTTERIQWRVKGDAAYPKWDKRGQIAQWRKYLQEALRASTLVNRFSSQQQMLSSLAFDDVNLLSSAEFLVHAEAYYRLSKSARCSYASESRNLGSNCKPVLPEVRHESN